MDSASILYLAVTGGLFLIFLAIVFRTYSSKRKESMEAPKYSIFDED